MSYLERYGGEVVTFVEVCQTLSAHLYVTGHGGNLAWRLEDDLFLITPTQMNKGDITAKDVVFIDGEGKTVEGQKRPTGETPMYINFFRERPDVESVIHCHPPMTGVFAITEGKNWLARPIFPETTTEVGPVLVVPYGEPLTQRLADNFLPYLRKANAFLMENHGLVIMSPRDIKWTMMLTELLEMTAVSILQAVGLGGIKEISKANVGNLDKILKIRDLPMFGAVGEYGSLVEMYYPD